MFEIKVMVWVIIGLSALSICLYMRLLHAQDKHLQTLQKHNDWLRERMANLEAPPVADDTNANQPQS